MKHTATQALVTIAIALAIVVAVKVIQARASEVLFAVMNDKAGKVSFHEVNLKDGYCVALVNKFTEQAKNGSPVTLTLPSPTFTGTVIEAYCVMPDGSTGAKFVKHLPALGIPLSHQHEMVPKSATTQSAIRADPVRTKPNPAMIGSCEARYARAQRTGIWKSRFGGVRECSR